MVKFFPLFLLIFISGINAQDIKISASVDSLNYAVGDLIHYQIKVEHPADAKITPPALKDSLHDVELLHELSPVFEEADKKQITTFTYVLSKYDSSDVTIPSLPVIYQLKGNSKLQTAFTNPVSFTVHTLNVELGEEIKDVKEPFTIPLDWKVAALWILIILAILLTANFIYRKFIKKKEEIYREPVIYIPPYEVALNSLTELEQKRVWQKGYVKEYHTRITEIIRKYFEDQFFLPALELPSSEIIENMKRRSETEKIIEITDDFFKNADMVKFAKFQPLNSVNEKMMMQAYEIVKQTMPKYEPEKSQEITDV